MLLEITNKNIKIQANSIEIGNAVTFGKNIDINVFGTFRIGDHSVLGSNTEIRGNNVIIGKHLFNSSGLKVGGGGRCHPNANLVIGDRCTIHNNFINVCEKVTIGDDVGLSPETSILTHGSWLSVLEGYPASAEPVNIGNEVLIGYRSLVLMGVTITNHCIIGAQSVVTKNICTKGVYAGSPAKFIKEIVKLNTDQKKAKLTDILERYSSVAKFHGLHPHIRTEYPFVYLNGFQCNVETFEYNGDEDAMTDDLRDYLRKWGIRIYTSRKFSSVIPKR